MSHQNRYNVNEIDVNDCGGDVVDLFKDRLGDMVREKRKSHGITQERLAEKVNVTTGMIGQIERGETMPSVETLEALIRQLDIDPQTLFFGSVRGEQEYTDLCTMITKMTTSQRHILLKFAKIILEDCP